MGFRVNNVTIVGNITKDLELRYTPNGVAIASFGLAYNKGIKNKDTGEWTNIAEFFNVTAWKELAENCSNSLKKGDRVVVAGVLTQNKWESKEGEKRSAINIMANVVAPSLEYATCIVAKIEKQPADSKDKVDFTDEDIPF